ncbi:MAG: CoA-binding protein [Spirochaetota bacterium]|nr:CoA-binding protein [Spirochaetota bacterium]
MDMEHTEKTSIIKSLDYVFDPGSVAVIGASNKIGSWGYGVMSRLLGENKRKIYPVNAKSSDIFGIKAYKNIEDIPDTVDFAVLSVAPNKTADVMRDCVEKGVKAALVISGGLAESGDEGEMIEKEIVDIAQKGGLRFIGPNSMGHTNTNSSFSTLAWMENVLSGPVAFLSQSGTYGQRVIRTGMHRGIGFSKFVSNGNEADLHMEDYIEYLAKDEKTKIITAYVEGLREGRRFFELAKEITREKPIILMKAGSTQGSAKAAKSHTAALSGSNEIYEAMFRQSGIIRVYDEEEMFDVVSALLSIPLPRGNRIGIITEGGGIGVMMAEATERAGLELPNFSPKTTEGLKSLLPSRCSYGNPTDITDLVTSGDLIIFSCLGMIMDDPNTDAVILLGGIGASNYFSSMLGNTSYADTDEFRNMVHSLKEQELNNLNIIKDKINELHKPLIYVNLMPSVMEEPESFKYLRERNIPIFPNPVRAATTLKHLVQYNNYLRYSK